ncbi:MAG: threonine/serine exporter [Provencibacterium sp.]|jgi:uncharacterized membrane protein YjjB (DUF3815 family)|nr:threonine/serine exporter [Provencibacterium sp.]
MISILLQLAAVYVCTIAVAILFHMPKEQFLFCGLAGMAAWMGYLLALRLSLSVVLASFISALLLTAISRIFAVTRRTPIIIFLVSGIFPLVPGAGIYYTAYYFIMGDNALALGKGVETIKIAVAIALGIVLMLSLPYSLFRGFGKRENPEKTPKL